ncbi:MAG TPA: helix-turn-helix transcriptional regulator [Streptosporangiales bacterium]
MQGDERIGTRVASVRKLRAMTQRELARRANVSYSLLTKVESGHAPATPAFIGAVARALRVPVPRIIGQPFPEADRRQSARLHATVDPIRRALLAEDVPTDAPPRSTAELAADVRRLSDLGRSASYVAIGETLPVLLDELATAVHAAPAAEQPRLYALLAEAYSGASSIANLLGHLDLRDRVVDRIERASRRCDDPLRVHRVQWQRSASLMAASAYDLALRLMDRTRRDLGDDPTGMDPRTLSVYGSLYLRSAILAARAARVNRADLARQSWAHVDAAREVAAMIGRDRDDYGLAFGPSNVAQHAVSVAVELEDGPEALRLARQTRLPGAVPAVRRGHHYIDVARGYLLNDDNRGALRALQTARRIAPQQTRHHPMVRETVQAIAANGRGNDELTRFASWLGLDG